jgi:ABC-type lipoprotein export system ATPase subunit
MLAALDDRFWESAPNPPRAVWPSLERSGAVHGASLSAIAVTIGAGARLFDELDWHVRAGMQVAITGPSGSGKTTLLHAIAGISQVRAGTILWNGLDVTRLPHHQREPWRRRTIGCIFSHAGLFPTFNALDNVMLPVTFGSWRASSEQRARAEALLDRAGVRPKSRVEDLSREARARVAIVRALWARPRVVLADEPIARLEGRAAEMARRFLQQLCSEAGTTLIVATRNRDLAETFENTFEIRDRRLVRFVR